MEGLNRGLQKIIEMKPTLPPKLDSTSVKTAYGAIDGSA